MGVSRLTGLLRASNVFESGGMALHDWSPGSPIYVDLLSCFYTNIKTAVKSPKKLQSFVYWLKSLFGDSRHRITILIDGLRSEEKHLAHSLRDDKVEKEIEALSNALTDCHTAQRLTGKLHHRVRKFIGRSFCLSHEEKMELFSALIQSGFQAVLCQGEVDLYVARMGHVTVLSRDSDFFCHGNVTTVLSPFFRRKQFLVRPTVKLDLLRILKINEPILRTLAIVSGNDYSKNKPGFGVKRNLDILK